MSYLWSVTAICSKQFDSLWSWLFDVPVPSLAKDGRNHESESTFSDLSDNEPEDELLEFAPKAVERVAQIAQKSASQDDLCQSFAAELEMFSIYLDVEQMRLVRLDEQDQLFSRVQYLLADVEYLISVCRISCPHPNESLRWCPKWPLNA